MKVQCPLCKHEIEFNELDFASGDKVSVECPRCGSTEEIIIPSREEETIVVKPKVNVRKIETEQPVVEENEAVVEPEPPVIEEVRPQVAEVTSPKVPAREKTKKQAKQSTASKPSKSTASSAKATTKDPSPSKSTASSAKAPTMDPSPSKSVSTSKKTSEKTQRTKPTTSYASSPTRKRTSKTDKPATISGCGCLGIILLIIGGVVGYLLWPSSDASTEFEYDATDVTVATADIAEQTVAEDYEYTPLEMASSVETADDYTSSLDSLTDTDISESQMLNPMGFKEGLNSFVGDMVHTDGRRFPFTLEFHFSPTDETISAVKYCNVNSGTKLDLTVAENTSDLIRFEGMDGGKLFRIEFSGTDPYYGDAWWGDFHQKVELSYKKD